MEAVTRVLNRIENIRNEVTAPPVPAHFRALLESQLRSRQPSALPEGRAAVEEIVAPQLAGPNLLTSQGVTTLGAMLGLGGTSTPGTSFFWPGSMTPVDGVATRGELESYLAVHQVRGRNGRLHEVELTNISGGWSGQAKLLPPAAVAWEEMRAAAATDGIDLRLIGSYRDYHNQASAYEKYLSGEKSAPVARPGHSEHGNGLAVDVTNGAVIGRDDPEWHWMSANARRFGFHPISSETWHWEFRGTG